MPVFNDSNGLLWLLVLIFVFIFFPTILRGGRKGPSDSGGFFKRFGRGASGLPNPVPVKTDKRIPKNCGKNELYQFVAKLLNFTRKKKWFLIVPGAVESGGKTASVLAILITHSAAIGVKCYGFGGILSGGKADDKWNQRVNGEDFAILNPVTAQKTEYSIIRGILDEQGMEKLPLEIVSVFTSPYAELRQNPRIGCYTEEEFFAYLLNSKQTQDNGVQPAEIGKRLKALVKKE